jgi:hypothetical protein
MPPAARLTQYPQFMQRYLNAPSVAATEKYAAGATHSSTAHLNLSRLHSSTCHLILSRYCQ